MADSQALHHHLLRPAIIHVLRGNGFASAKPSVLDTLTDLTARYIQLIATRTADHVFDRTLAAVDDDCFAELDAVLIAQDDLIPSITDVRLALADSSFFPQTMTAGEEAWAEALRRPLSQMPAGARDKEQKRRDMEDTRDIREFVDWATGSTAHETRRVAGLLQDSGTANTAAPQATSTATTAANTAAVKTNATVTTVNDLQSEKQDYLTILKKKKGKHSDESRYAGTVLGKESDEGRSHKIEGGPHTMGDWKKTLKRKHDELVT